MGRVLIVAIVLRYSQKLAVQQNLIISEGQGFFPEIVIPSSSVDPYRFIRLPFSCVDEERLKEGIWRMAASVNALI